jgi:DNA-binding IclR family transcriptional regulator
MVKSATRTLDILELVAGVPDGLSHTEIGRRLGIPKSSLTGILRDLTARRYLDVSEKAGAFTIGSQTLVLARGFLGRINVIRVLTPLLRDLRDRTGQAVTLSIIRHDEVVVVGQEAAHGFLSPIMRVGDRAPVMRTASGRALAAFLEFADLERILTKERFEPVEVTDLLRQFERIRAGGIARADGKWIPDIVVMALPVFGHESDQPCASLAVAVPNSRFTENYAGEIETTLRATTDEACTRLGDRRVSRN